MNVLLPRLNMNVLASAKNRLGPLSVETYVRGLRRSPGHRFRNGERELVLVVVGDLDEASGGERDVSLWFTSDHHLA